MSKKIFKVNIIERLIETVYVEAEDQSEAEDIVGTLYYDQGEFEVDEIDGSDITATEIAKKDVPKYSHIYTKEDIEQEDE